MEQYTDFAKAYSLLMQDIPYGKWEKYLAKTLRENGIKDGLVLDLGCGTGEMTRRLRDRGYDMIGVDSSLEMLDEAGKSGAEGILYLNQDMRSFELYGTVRAIVSVCDTMNYLTTEKDFVKVLRLANNYLDPDGIFIFDLKTAHFFKNCMGESTFAENLEDLSYIWENSYDEKKRINEYFLTMFFKEKQGYKKSEELHIQRAYPVSEIRQMTKKAGMKFEKALDADTYGPVTPGSKRIYIILREQGKGNE